jgi:glutamate synthase domain-containing protein 2
MCFKGWNKWQQWNADATMLSHFLASEKHGNEHKAESLVPPPSPKTMHRKKVSFLSAIAEGALTFGALGRNQIESAPARALADFLRSSRSGTGATQTRDYLKEKVAAAAYKVENTAVGVRHADHLAPSIRKSWH